MISWSVTWLVWSRTLLSSICHTFSLLNILRRERIFLVFLCIHRALLWKPNLNILSPDWFVVIIYSSSISHLSSFLNHFQTSSYRDARCSRETGMGIRKGSEKWLTSHPHLRGFPLPEGLRSFISSIRTTFITRINHTLIKPIGSPPCLHPFNLSRF